MANAAVKSFNGSQPLHLTQTAALLRWKQQDLQASWKDPQSLTSQTLSELSDILSDIFFLSELSSSRSADAGEEASILQVRWEPLRESLRGVCRFPLSSTTTTPKIQIALNSACSPKPLDSKGEVVGVLLHEMAHGFLMGCEASKARQKGGETLSL